MPASATPLRRLPRIPRHLAPAPLPHPSWRAGDGQQGARARIGAHEFWQRLGL